MIEVSVTKQLNGAVFGLTPETQIMLQSRFPGWSPAPDSVFISYGRPWDFESMKDPMWTQIVLLLTRLTEQQIQELGGGTFVHPVSHEVLFESHAALHVPKTKPLCGPRGSDGGHGGVSTARLERGPS